MKKITLLLIAMISYVGYSQNTIDFETGGEGADWSWIVSENGTNPALQFVANPNPSGNTSTTTAELTTEAAGASYALAYSDNIGSFTLNANNSLVKMWVRKSVVSDVAIKFEIPDGISVQKVVANTVTNGDWEELSFDFSSDTGTTYSRIVIIPDFLDRTSENIVYFDQITFNALTPEACAGTSSIVQDGSVPESYNYAFETLTNSDVRMTFELPQVNGLVAYAWKQNPFSETTMIVTDNVATLDLAGYSPGETISYAVKFAWEAGGFAVTKYFSYTVGDDCTAGVDDYSLSAIKMYPNPANGIVRFSTASSEFLYVSVFNLLGKQVMPVQTIQSELNISSLNTGVYFVKMDQGSNTVTKKLLVN